MLKPKTLSPTCSDISRAARCFFVGRAVRAPALARHGELGARAQLASRISRKEALRSVATSMWQFGHELRSAVNITP